MATAPVARTARHKFSLWAAARACSGFASLGVFAGAAALAIALLVTAEAQRAFTIRQNVEDELSRAANIAVALAMSDSSRQDYIRELDGALARDSFYGYLHDGMSLSGSLEARAPDGRSLYRLEIASLDISSRPPRVSVSASVAFEPAFLGNLAPITIRLPVRATSVNHDMLE